MSITKNPFFFGGGGTNIQGEGGGFATHLVPSFEDDMLPLFL
jgi:hypothetical protein